MTPCPVRHNAARRSRGRAAPRASAGMTQKPGNAIVLIPSRLASTRLPNKPLADIHGEPMIVHVWRRGMDAKVGPVVVACGDAEIATAVERAGGRAVMTDPALPSGSD